MLVEPPPAFIFYVVDFFGLKASRKKKEKKEGKQIEFLHENGKWKTCGLSLVWRWRQIDIVCHAEPRVSE